MKITTNYKDSVNGTNLLELEDVYIMDDNGRRLFSISQMLSGNFKIHGQAQKKVLALIPRSNGAEILLIDN